VDLPIKNPQRRRRAIIIDYRRKRREKETGWWSCSMSRKNGRASSSLNFMTLTSGGGTCWWNDRCSRPRQQLQDGSRDSPGSWAFFERKRVDARTENGQRSLVRCSSSGGDRRYSAGKKTSDRKAKQKKSSKTKRLRAVVVKQPRREAQLRGLCFVSQPGKSGNSARADEEGTCDPST